MSFLELHGLAKQYNETALIQGVPGKIENNSIEPTPIRMEMKQLTI